jgi:hypothetical protein
VHAHCHCFVGKGWEEERAVYHRPCTLDSSKTDATELNLSLSLSLSLSSNINVSRLTPPPLFPFACGATLMQPTHLVLHRLF